MCWAKTNDYILSGGSESGIKRKVEMGKNMWESVVTDKNSLKKNNDERRNKMIIKTKKTRYSFK